ncbi:TlpA family protein disulfide reductase [Ancylobacter sp. VKM B-3255]|uniref:TlpA family protein disulfide reductase n=2 Tax=Ancylobacter radicis TaxID=2836179 RepID=A0ABS5R7Y6_9HYPH|nr:TlpA family protein disulfide reductase [Ancylobacter radicis]
MAGLVLASLASLTPGAGVAGVFPASPASPAPSLAPSPAPTLELPSLDGGIAGLAALRGRPVLVHFFATWCEPCREELGGLSRLAATRDASAPDGGLAVLAVDVGEVKLRLRRFLDREFAGRPPAFPILLDEDRAVSRAWNVSVLPASLLLDSAHAIRLTADGPVDWDDPAARRVLDALTAPATAPATDPSAAATLARGLPPLID